MAPIVGYWKCRGLGHAIRMLLKYNEVEFENRMYEQGDAPDYSRESFLKERDSLGLVIPNLPYYIDGDTKITESQAILRHLGRKFDLMGGTEEERIRNDMIISFQTDMRSAFVGMVYNPNFDTLKEGFVKSLPERLTKFSNFLADRQFFAGEKLTLCDFLAYDVLDIYRNFAPDCMEEFQSLKDYMARFEALPTIKAYMESDSYMKKPFNNKIAKWGNEA